MGLQVRRASSAFDSRTAAMTSSCSVSQTCQWPSCGPHWWPTESLTLARNRRKAVTRTGPPVGERPVGHLRIAVPKGIDTLATLEEGDTGRLPSGQFDATTTERLSQSGRHRLTTESELRPRPRCSFCLSHLNLQAILQPTTDLGLQGQPE